MFLSKKKKNYSTYSTPYLLISCTEMFVSINKLAIEIH